MAVVQISKIQLRRGQKNSVSGIPQLASAEMAWAVDSQELYIGNGSVAEGAPYVGNTRILTEHENLLGLISSYQYAADDPSMSPHTTSRSIQDKLDEIVSVADFGLYPDSANLNQDNALIFNNAVDVLYSSTLDPERYTKVLMIPNGTYTFNSGLIIPSNVILRGETPFGVIFNIGDNDITFVSADGTTFENINSADYPKNVNISNIKFARRDGKINLSGLRDSVFDNVGVEGDYSLGLGIADPLNEIPALYWENIAAEINTTNIQFTNCVFSRNSISIKADNIMLNDTEIIFDDCKFVDNYYGTVVNGLATQGTFWTYHACTFEKIYKQAFLSNAGRGTVIKHSVFKNVGNAGSTAAYPQAPMVEFGETVGNTVIDCSSDRMQKANIQGTGSIHAVPEVLNADKTMFNDRMVAEFGLSDTPVPFAVISAEANTYTIDYVLRLGELYRKGKLIIAVSDVDNPSNDDVSMFDTFTCSPNLSATPAGMVISEFQFHVNIHDNNSDGINDTIALLYRNDLVHQGDDSVIAPGQTGNMSFSIEYCN